MSETDLTAEELEIKILRELTEDESGSDAFPSEVIYDAMNDTYEEIFNGGHTQKNVRTQDYAFNLIADVSLDGDLDPGDLSIVLTDSSNLPASGRILIGNEFIDYTANDLATTLTCDASAISQTHSDGDKVRVLYALPSGIDKEEYQEMNINGIHYDPVDVSKMLDSDRSNYRNYSIYESYIIMPENTTTEPVLFIYTPALTRVTTGSEKFSLLPNNYRVALIVTGAVGRLKMQDQQSDYQLWYRPPQSRGDKGGGRFYHNLWRFYANYGKKGSNRNKRKAASIYD